MNRTIILFFFILIIGCDTPDNVKPLGEEYFVKFYGATGNQQGIAVKATPDGGFIIGGNSISEFGGQSDYLLIKVDALGNQEWLESYDFNGTNSNDFLTDVLIDGNSFVIAGTSTIGTVDKMVLIRIGEGGGVIENTLIIGEQSNNSFQLNGISTISSGGYLVTGSITSGESSQYGKSIVGLVNSDFMIMGNPVFYPSTPSNQDKEIVFVKGLEVLNSTTDQSNYLFFGYVNSTNGPKLNIYQFNADLDPPLSAPTPINYNESKIVDVIKIGETEYKLLSSSDNETYLINVTETPSGYALGSDQFVRSNRGFINGVSLNYSSSNQFLVSSNVKLENSDITSSSIQESTVSGLINWQRFFGTELSYTSGEVIAMADGSVVYTGTAGFKGQQKVFLIKLKSNGEMK